MVTGLILVLAHAQPGDAPSDEFYVLGFSAARDSYRKVVWYYNKDLALRRLSDNVLVQTFEDGSKVGFELLIPWEESARATILQDGTRSASTCAWSAQSAQRREKSIFLRFP